MGIATAPMVAVKLPTPVGYVVSARRIADRRMILTGYQLGRSADTCGRRIRKYKGPAMTVFKALAILEVAVFECEKERQHTGSNRSTGFP